MKKILSVLAVAAITMSSCSKDALTSPPSSLSATSVDASHGSDDPAGNDRGGGLNGGGGTRISAASVPMMVMNAYKSKFPGATRAEWKKLNGNYKVEFYRNGVKWEAIFSPAGKLLKLERD